MRGEWEVLMYVCYRANLAAGLPNSDQRSRLSLCIGMPSLLPAALPFRLRAEAEQASLGIRTG